VKSSTRAEVERWWRRLFDVDEQLWSRVTVVHAQGELAGYDGWYVAWRDAGVHISAPSSSALDEMASLRRASASDLQEPEFWQAFARERGLVVIGPSVHHFLDEDPGAGADVREVAASELRPLAERVEQPDLWESGFDVHLDEPGIVAFAADGGGAVLTELAGAPRNVALLVAREARGRGVGTELGRAAASYAVRHHGWCRWRAADTNVASSRAAARLGFVPYATQLAVRRAA
jgi:GNAT superfamily N-acetyltransferase